MRPTVGPSATRVFLATYHLHAAGGTVTVAEVAERCGLAKSTVWGHLWNLAELGLVDWSPGQAGTLHPLVREVR